MILIKIAFDAAALEVRADIPALPPGPARALAPSLILLPYETGAAMEAGDPVSLSLPFQSWRHILRRAERGYGRLLAMRAHPAARGGSPLLDAEPPEAERLGFELGGAFVPCVRALPGPADLWAEVGSFEVGEQGIRACDPCYDRSSASACLIPAEPGVWRSMALLRDDGASGFGNGMMVARLAAVLGGAELPSDRELSHVGTAGVDSGQCGLFDEELYPRDPKQNLHDDGTFYKEICDSMAGPDCYGDNMVGAAIAPGACGAASRTFYGDGSYALLAKLGPSGKAVALTLAYDTSERSVYPEAREPEEPDGERAPPGASSPGAPEAMRRIAQAAAEKRARHGKARRGKRR